MDEESIPRNVAIVRERMEKAARDAGRNVDDITLVAVSKKVEPERIREAYRAGIRDFGENYVQESRQKIGSAVLQFPDLRWHFIGHLQTNKVRDVVGGFTMIQSVDSVRLATAVGAHAVRSGLQASILMEVKLDEPSAKSGFPPAEAVHAAAEIARIPGVRLGGLMGIAPQSNSPGTARGAFRILRSIFDELPEAYRQVLSMGMSGDFEDAIAEGSTMLRIGTAIFGDRPP